MLKTYEIRICGCDDTTVFEYVLTAEQANLISNICERSEEVSTYGCMPTLEISEVTK